MAKFKEIDLETWDRKEEFTLYSEIWTTVCYSVTKKLDVTHTVRFLKGRGIKIVPCLYYLCSRALNTVPNFRLAQKNGKTGYWETIQPQFTVMNKNKNITFHTVPYSDDFCIFYENYLNEMKKNGEYTGISAGTMPENGYIISVLPYLSFDAFSFHIKNPKGYYAPVVEIGKYETEGERLKIPVSVTVNHAAVDAWHVSEFFKSLQEGLNSAEIWGKDV